MNIREITLDILAIAGEIENNNLSYPLAPLVKAGKRENPADLLRGVAIRFSTETKYIAKPDAPKIKAAVKELTRIKEIYKISKIRRPIDNLSALLDSSN